MLNPSTADDEVDDPTIRSCVRLTRGLGYAGIEVVNLFGLRAPDPRALLAAEDPVGPENDREAERATARAETIIFAWGAHPAAARRADLVSSLTRRAYADARVPRCFGTTKSGAPRHPLYVRSGTPLIVYDDARDQ